MSISKKIIVVALLSLLGEPLVSAADQTTANVPVDSVYYQYLDKLSGMGYVKSLPNGAKPYSRMQLARWVLEAKEAADGALPGGSDGGFGSVCGAGGRGAFRWEAGG